MTDQHDGTLTITLRVGGEGMESAYNDLTTSLSDAVWAAYGIRGNTVAPFDRLDGALLKDANGNTVGRISFLADDHDRI